jgi:hypothetical protein
MLVINIIIINFVELDELDYQMKVELDSKELTAPNKRIVSKREEDEKELENMIK